MFVISLHYIHDDDVVANTTFAAVEEDAHRRIIGMMAARIMFGIQKIYNMNIEKVARDMRY